MVRGTRVIALLMTATLVGAACGKSGPTSTQNSSGTGAAVKGGTMRLAMASDFHEALDPAREYYTIGWEVLKCCLARTLLNFNLQNVGHDGNSVVPDLATALPTQSSDQLTYTFTIRQGVKYAPPFQNDTVQAQDFIRALTREALSATAASYPFYYTDITGFNDVASGKSKSISGMTAPSPQTLVVHLDKPIGYFPYVFTLPATAPIPPLPNNPSAPVGAATGHNQNYGQFIASTGPYEFQGAESIDYSKPASQQKGPSGFQAGKSYVLVRNPSWDAATDPLRKAYVDQFDFTVGGAVPDLENKIESADFDTMDAQPDPQGIQAYETNPTLKPFIHSDPTGGEFYVNLNVAMPPFDDVHVRKAVNWITDKAGLQRLNGGPIKGEIGTHDIPTVILPSEATYDPYKTPGEMGSLAQAKAEMMQSKYDSNHDGICDASACKNVLTVIDQTDPQPKMAALLQQDFQEIGISLDIKPFQTTTMYTKCEDATQMVPVCPSEGWYQDFPDTFGYATGIFSSASLTPSCCDDSELGATTKQLMSWHYANTAPAPSVDAQLNACVPTQGAARESCYAGVDHTLMEQVVPWVPYLFANQVVVTSPRVQNYQLDASTGWISLALASLANGGK